MSAWQWQLFSIFFISIAQIILLGSTGVRPLCLRPVIVATWSYEPLYSLTLLVCSSPRTCC